MMQRQFIQFNFICITIFLLAFVLVGCKEKAEEVTLYPLAVLESGTDKVLAEFLVERAKTAQEQEIGLMNRENLSLDKGMLFVYDKPAFVYFWMKNTLIPLDMIFINADNVITHIHKNAKPHDLSPVGSNGAIRSVLEINAGLSDKYGFKTGDKIIFSNF